MTGANFTTITELVLIGSCFLWSRGPCKVPCSGCALVSVKYTINVDMSVDVKYLNSFFKYLLLIRILIQPWSLVLILQKDLSEAFITILHL